MGYLAWAAPALARSPAPTSASGGLPGGAWAALSYDLRAPFRPRVVAAGRSRAPYQRGRVRSQRLSRPEWTLVTRDGAGSWTGLGVHLHYFLESLTVVLWARVGLVPVTVSV